MRTQLRPRRELADTRGTTYFGEHGKRLPMSSATRPATVPGLVPERAPSFHECLTAFHGLRRVRHWPPVTMESKSHRMNPMGANSWVWVSPPTDAAIAEIAPRVKALGFDLLEMGVENPDEWDPVRIAEILAANDLGALVCAVMGEGRDLLQRDLIASTQDYIRTCIDTAVTVGSRVVAGPVYAPAGKTWRIDNVERAVSIDRLVEGLRPLATTRASVVSASPSNRSIASRRASSAPQCRRWRSSTASIPQRSGCCRTPFI
jgi:hypothetical protein